MSVNDSIDRRVTDDSYTVGSSVIVSGEIFTIELQPGSAHRGGIDSGQTECELNAQH